MADPLRIRMKTWHDIETGRGYLLPIAFADPTSNIVHAYAMSDAANFQIRMTVDQWNAIPYLVFEALGPAERPKPQPPTFPARDIVHETEQTD